MEPGVESATEDNYRFYENLSKITGDRDPSHYCYAGGRTGSHRSYVKTQKIAEDSLPPPTDRCVCKHTIRENCFLKHKPTGQLIVVGNCCIKRYVPSCGRTCEKCGNPHKNRKDNLCKRCRNNEKDRKFTIDDRIYLIVPFDKKDSAKSKNARWDTENKSWYAESSLNTDLISLFPLRSAELQIVYKEKAKISLTSRISHE
jgi:hypothetical protein